MAAVLTCEQCGRTPAEALFSKKMCDRSRCLAPGAYTFSGPLLDVLYRTRAAPEVGARAVQHI